MSGSKPPRPAKRAKPPREDSGAQVKPRRAPYLKAAERRRLILEAAKDVFAKSSLQGASTRDIAKAANINQATLFSHFPSKDALFLESVVSPLLAAVREMCDRKVPYDQAQSTQGVVDLSRAVTERHLKILIEVFPLLTSSLFSDEETGRKLYAEQIAAMLSPGDVLDDVLRDDLDRDFVGLAMFGVLFAMAMNEHFCGPSDDVSEVARKVATFGNLGFVRESFRD